MNKKILYISGVILILTTIGGYAVLSGIQRSIIQPQDYDSCGRQHLSSPVPGNLTILPNGTRQMTCYNSTNPVANPGIAIPTTTVLQ